MLSFIGAVALGDKNVWDTVNELETKAKKGKRESLYQFYESGLGKKSTGKSKGIFVAVKTLVGQGGGTIGVTDTGHKLTEYILDVVQDQYHAENGKAIWDELTTACGEALSSALGYDGDTPAYYVHTAVMGLFLQRLKEAA